MARMIVYKGGTFRRPNSRLSFTFEASPIEQNWPQDVVNFAVAKGWAEEVKPSRKRKAATARKGEK